MKKDNHWNIKLAIYISAQKAINLTATNLSLTIWMSAISVYLIISPFIGSNDILVLY